MSCKKLAWLSGIALTACLISGTAFGQASNVPSVITGTDSTGSPIYSPVGTGSNGSVPMPTSGGGGGGGGAVYGPTANGTPAANPPVLVGGTADGTGTGAVENAKVDSSGNQYVICSSGCSGSGGGNAAASATGSAVPTDGSYNALNVAGTLRGQTGVNPSGWVYSSQNDTTSVGGATVLTGAGAVGTGSQRMAVGQDATTVAGAAPATTGIYVTGPSAAALSTSALQTTGNTSLGTIATNTTNAGTPSIFTNSFTASVTPTISTSTYTAGFEVGGLMSFTSVTRTPGFSGIINTVSLTASNVQSAELDLYLCDSNPSSSTWTDHTAPAINAADVTKCKWEVPLTANASGLGTHTTYSATGIGLSFVLPASGTTLYGILVTPQIPSGVFGSTTGITVTIAGVKD